MMGEVHGILLLYILYPSGGDDVADVAGDVFGGSAL